MSQPAEQMNVQGADWIVKVAETEEEQHQAMRLRYEVFVEEAGNGRLRNDFRLERDEYDVFCDHLIVKDQRTGKVIGTYRLLPGRRADEGIGFYSETEFELTGIASIRRLTLELGRSCVSPAYRNGKAIQLLWEGIVRYIHMNDYHYLIGCASYAMEDLRQLNEVYTWLRRKSIVTDRFGITPLETHRIEGLQILDEIPAERELLRQLPPLIKGYQWLGAEIGGEPAFDPVFNTVDFLIVLERSKIEKRYKRHFLTEAARV